MGRTLVGQWWTPIGDGAEHRGHWTEAADPASLRRQLIEVAETAWEGLFLVTVLEGRALVSSVPTDLDLIWRWDTESEQVPPRLDGVSLPPSGRREARLNVISGVRSNLRDAVRANLMDRATASRLLLAIDQAFDGVGAVAG